jgi:TPR repeat protein
MYAQGRGVTQDYKEAVKWFRLAAAQGNAGAIANLKLPEMVAAAQNSTPDRRSTSIKTGTQQEEQVSSKTNRKTEQPRHTTTRTETPERATVNAAPMDDAIAAHQRGDYAQAIKIWRSLAAQGNADAQTVLGGGLLRHREMQERNTASVICMTKVGGLLRITKKHRSGSGLLQIRGMH